MSRMLRISPALLAIVLIAGLLAPEVVGAKGNGYAPPYKQGPQGGDDFNHVESDPESGRITIIRAHPEPGPIGCPDSHAGWSTFRIKHRVRHRRRPVKAVAVHYSETEMDHYSWIMATVKKRRKSIGYKAYQGPAAAESGKLVVKLKRRVKRGRIVIDFGLQTSGACGQAEAASAMFPRVKVRLAKRR